MRARRGAAVLAVAASMAVALAACGSDGDSAGSITVGSANFGESEIIAEMYAQYLADHDYDVSTKLNVGARDVYLKAMENGEIDLVPEYLATLTENFNTKINGPDAPSTEPKASSDAAATFANLQLLAGQLGFVVTPYSEAVNQNAFAVTAETATAGGYTKVSDLASANGLLVLGGPPECPERPYCLPGLESTYGLTFKEFKALDAGGPNTIGALNDGTIDVGLVFSSDGAVANAGLVVLEDDKGLQSADNIIGLFTAAAGTGDALELINDVNAALTTEDLQQLNKRFSIDKEDASKLAEEWLTDKGLL